MWQLNTRYFFFDGVISTGNTCSENPMALFPQETASPNRRRARVLLV